MRHLFRQLAFASALLMFAPSVWAQGYDSYGEGDDYMPTRNGDVLRNQIDLELVDLVSSSLSLRYERSLTRWASVAIHPQWWWGGDTSQFDFGVTLQLRWYPDGHAMEGWYLSPQFGFFQLSGYPDGPDSYAQDRSYVYAALAGYNWIIARAFSLYFGAGVAYAHGSDNLNETYHYPLYVLGPFPVFEFGIGVPF